VDEASHGPAESSSARGQQSREPGEVREIAVRGESIRLGQFLKLADLVESGADVKPLVAGGGVTVNGSVETRRGRQLSAGDLVTVEGTALRVGTMGTGTTAAEAPGARGQ